MLPTGCLKETEGKLKSSSKGKDTSHLPEGPANKRLSPFGTSTKNRPKRENQKVISGRFAFFPRKAECQCRIQDSPSGSLHFSFPIAPISPPPLDDLSVGREPFGSRGIQIQIDLGFLVLLVPGSFHSGVARVFFPYFPSRRPYLTPDAQIRNIAEIDIG